MKELLRSMTTGAQRFLWALLGRLRKSDRFWELIAGTGIVVFVGPNGSGKSLAAVHSILPVLDGQVWNCDDPDHKHMAPVNAHRQECELCVKWGDCPALVALLAQHSTGERLVYSTVKLLDDDGQTHRLFRPLIDFRQLVTIEHAVVLMDEVTGVSDASTSSSLPTMFTFWAHTCRKGDVQLRITSPDFDRCSKPIRQVAQVLVDARSFFPELANNGRLWRPRQAMLYRAFDAKDFAHFSAHQRDTLKSLGAAAFWRPGSRAERAYNTLAQVLMLGHVTEAGMCSVCGGARSAPKCACPSHVDGLGLHEVEIVEKVSPSGTRTRMAVVHDADAL